MKTPEQSDSNQQPTINQITVGALGSYCFIKKHIMSTNNLIYIITDENYYNNPKEEIRTPYEFDIKKFAHIDVLAKAIRLKCPEFIIIESTTKSFQRAVKKIVRNQASSKVQIIIRKPKQSSAEVFTQIYDKTINRRKLRTKLRATILLGAVTVSLACTFTFLDKDSIDVIVLINAVILFSISSVLYLIDPTDWIIKD